MATAKKKYPEKLTYVGEGRAATVPGARPEESSRVVQFGDVVEVTDHFVEATRDRFGETWLDHLDGSTRWRVGDLDGNADIAEQLSLSQLEAAEARRLEHVRESRRYGRAGRAEAAAKRQADAVEDYRQRMSQTTAGAGTPR